MILLSLPKRKESISIPSCWMFTIVSTVIDYIYIYIYIYMVLCIVLRAGKIQLGINLPWVFV